MALEPADQPCRGPGAITCQRAPANEPRNTLESRGKGEGCLSMLGTACSVADSGAPRTKNLYLQRIGGEGVPGVEPLPCCKGRAALASASGGRLAPLPGLPHPLPFFGSRCGTFSRSHRPSPRRSRQCLRSTPPVCGSPPSPHSAAALRSVGRRTARSALPDRRCPSSAPLGRFAKRSAAHLALLAYPDQFINRFTSLAVCKGNCSHRSKERPSLAANIFLQ